MSLTQGGALPDVTNTQTQVTQAPDWYSNYLQDTATRAQQGAGSAQYIGPTANQTAGWNLASSNVGNWQPQMNNANELTMSGAKGSALNAGQPYFDKSMGMSGTAAGLPDITGSTRTAPSVIDQYMNPYMKNVVDEIGRLGNLNIRQNLTPSVTSGIVGSGQFGSTRGANALGQNIQNAVADMTGKQGAALASGYQSSMSAAQADLARQLQAGVAAGQLTEAEAARILQTGSTAGGLADRDFTRQLQGGAQFGNLAKLTQDLGMNDVNALLTSGEQQRTIEQNRQLFPLMVAAQEASAMQGKQIPMTVTSSIVGPQPGSYQNSPLSTIAGLGSLLYGSGKVASGVSGALSKLFSGSGGSSTPINPLTANDGWGIDPTSAGFEVASPSSAGLDFFGNLGA